MRLQYPAALLVALLVSTSTWSVVFKCTDADGRVTYTNDKSIARDCKPISTDQPVSSIPAPPRRPAATATPQTPSAGGFPNVPADTQRARDADRRQILEAELATEERALAEAQAALAEQESIRTGDERNFQRVLDRLQPFKDKVELHQRNVEALRREMRTLR